MEAPPVTEVSTDHLLVSIIRKEFEEVRRFLKSDRADSYGGDWAEALRRGVESDCDEDISLLLFDRLMGSCEDIMKNHSKQMKDVLRLASSRNMTSLVRRLVNLVDVASYTSTETPLHDAVLNDHRECLEVFLSAGFRPTSLLTGESSYSSCSQNGNWFEYLMDMSDDIWKLVVTYLKAEDIIESLFFSHFIRRKKGGDVLLKLKKLGMDFTSCMKSSSYTVKACVRDAVYFTDISTVRFLLDNGLDVHAGVAGSKYSQPALQYLIGLIDTFLSCRPTHQVHSMFDIIVELLKHGANPCQKDCNGRSVEGDTILWKPGEAQLRKLFFRLGFASFETQEFLLTHDFITEIKPVSLQVMCRKNIRMEKGSNLKNFMKQHDYPQILEDFVMLKDIDWEEYRITEADLGEVDGESNGGDDDEEDEG